MGFRFTAVRLATELDILGWVSNSEDGRVELAAEGAQENIENFLAQLSNTFSRYIKDVQVDWEPATGEFKDFGVKF